MVSNIDSTSSQLDMLKVLLEIETQLPELLEDTSAWKSLFVDYETPFVQRLWRQVGGNRVYLHAILPCDQGQALFHRHNWPSAMRIVQGRYEMEVGYGEGDARPLVASRIVLAAGSLYEMTTPHAWHSVRPLDGKPVYSVMITGEPWGGFAPKSSTPLGALSQEIAEEMFLFFRDKLGGVRRERDSDPQRHNDLRGKPRFIHQHG